MRPRLGPSASVIWLTLLVAACAPAKPPLPHNAPPPDTAVPLAPADLPADAIRRGPDFYLVPLGRDAQGCLAYRPYSRHHLVAQVIYYADGKGGFVVDKNQAACGAVEQR